LDDWDKQVFRTGIEIDQRWIIDHAAARQEFICQAQSVNLFFAADENVATLHDAHFRAWKKGLKTLYYCRSEAIKRAEVVSNQVGTVVPLKQRVAAAEEVECLACEG
jgi:ribonucleoside-diphosphate reductase alpha chain